MASIRYSPFCILDSWFTPFSFSPSRDTKVGTACELLIFDTTHVNSEQTYGSVKAQVASECIDIPWRDR